MSHDMNRPGLYRNVFYTIEEAAGVLGVSKRTIFRRLGEDGLKRTKVGNALRIYGADLAEHLGIPIEDVPVKESS